jgi:hypothetical protein
MSFALNYLCEVKYSKKSFLSIYSGSGINCYYFYGFGGVWLEKQFLHLGDNLILVIKFV